MPKLSIITINLNNLRGLQKTMQSVFKQTFSDYEYIIIDGGSTDGSNEYIEQNANELSYWVSEKDSGIYNAMNKGILKAKGELVIFLNSGDFYVSPNLFSYSLSLFNCDRADLFFCSIIWDDPKLKVFYHSINAKIWYEEDLKKANFPHPGTFYKRTVFDKVGLFNENFRVLGDYEWNCKALINLKVPFQSFDIITAYFVAEGISNNASFMELREKENLEIKEKYFLKGPPINIKSIKSTLLKRIVRFAFHKKLNRV